MQTIFQTRGEKEDILNFVRNINAKILVSAGTEWARLEPLVKPSATATATSSGSPPFSSSSHGLIHMVTTVPISKPPIHSNPNPSQNDYTQSLANLWISSGHEYTDLDTTSITQIVITFNPHQKETSKNSASKKQLYCYPANKVTRLLAGINPDLSEIQEIRQALKELDPEIELNTQKCENRTSNNIDKQEKVVVLHPRSGFIANEDYVILSVDYSQIELRLMAHFSSDENLLSVFHSSKEDVFKTIASRWRKKPPAQVSSKERDSVKQICYAIIYGAGSGLVANKLVSNIISSKFNEINCYFQEYNYRYSLVFPRYGFTLYYRIRTNK